MINEKKILAIIPARSGSKGIPNKNIKLMMGKPLIEFTIGEAKKSKYLDKIIVSTDSEEIADISRNLDITVPFIRPKRIAEDNSDAKDVIIHALEYLLAKKEIFDYFIYLQPTSPFRTFKNIDSAIEKIIGDPDASTLVSLVKTKKNPFWMKRIDKEGYIKNFFDHNNYYRRQDLPEVYSLNGAIYMSEVIHFIENKDFLTAKCIPFIMNEIESLDIDDEDDWNYCEFLMEKLI